MKVILQKEVGKLGTPGEVVTVADGYARNFLVPRGLAIPASKGALRHAEGLKRVHGERVAKARTEAEAVAERLAQVTIRVTHRAGEEGKLFGSITAQEVAEELERQAGEPVDRRAIHLEEPIRSIGPHQVQIRLHPEVTAAITLEVQPEA
ncbi:MAG: 50S ribosomal protein L9 [Actinomycetota bacterium]